MPLILFGGKLLTVGGKLATSIDCCCTENVCCDCPTPESWEFLTAKFVQVSGPSCDDTQAEAACPDRLDGFEHLLQAAELEPGQECFDLWTSITVDTICGGVIDLELRCTSANEMTLTETVGGGQYLQHPLTNAAHLSQWISGQCDPFRWVFRFKITNGAATLCENESEGDQIFDVIITET